MSKEDIEDLTPDELAEKKAAQESRLKLQGLLREKLKKPVYVVEADEHLDVEHLLLVPFNGEFDKDAAKLKGAINLMLKTAGYTPEEIKAAKGGKSGVMFKIPAPLLQEIFPGATLNSSQSLVSAVRQKHKALGNAQVELFQDGIIVRGIPEGTSRGVLLTNEQIGRGLKNKIHADIVIAVELSNHMLETIAKRAHASHAASLKAQQPDNSQRKL